MRTNEKVKKTGRTIVVRARVTAIVLTALLALLLARLANLQLVDAGGLKNAALNQYTHEITIPAKRGTVYDRNLKPLAVSATVYNVFVSPNEIKDDVQEKLVIEGLARILKVDKNDIILKLQKKSSKYQIIKKMIEDAEENQIRSFIKENELSRVINLEETTKRYYPYGTLASHLLGFTGTDNNGLAGIEYTYDEYLKGINGRAIKGYDGLGNDLPFKYESFIEAQNGLSVVTTIDYTIQSILEKYIQQAYKDNKPKGSVKGIIMDVNSGEVLAEALYPNFDLNQYNTLSPYYQGLYDSFQGTDEEKAAYKSTLMYKMWDNSIATKTYEPGSTFKIVTSSMALEEKVVLETDHFFCSGSIRVPGISQPIHCHSRPHGDQEFPKALRNSCNPAFVQIGMRIGNANFKKYFKAFGYTEPSGSDIPGEAKTIYYGYPFQSQFETVELAVYSFGQTFKVTPLQHLRAVSTVANGGDLVTPHVVKALVDSNGKTVQTFEYKTDRQVISKETCDIIKRALTNSTQNACVSGYNVISKTGTSEIRDTVDIKDDYISSCVTFAPAENPQIAILIMVEEPTSGQYFGSLVAAPVVSKILSEVLPYLGIEPTHKAEDLVTVGSYIGSEIETAKLSIKNMGVNCIVKGNGTVVTSQVPEANASVTKDGYIVLYTDDTQVEKTVRVPNLSNMTPSTANKMVLNNDLNIKIKGIFNGDYTNCSVVSQSPAAGELVAPGTVVEVEFRYDEKIE